MIGVSVAQNGKNGKVCELSPRINCGCLLEDVKIISGLLGKRWDGIVTVSDSGMEAKLYQKMSFLISFKNKMIKSHQSETAPPETRLTYYLRRKFQFLGCRFLKRDGEREISHIVADK